MTDRTHIGDVDQLVEDLVTRLAWSTGRFALGVVGPPGAGKSTLAAEIVILVADRISAIVAPLDGFHRSNEELQAIGLLPLKGIPATFDAEAFAALLGEVRAGATVQWPAYDRTRQEVVPGAILIEADHRLIVVEGNYLLLDDPPWDRIAGMLDESWYLDVPDDVIVPRLIARHLRDRSEAAAVRKVATTDLPNAALVATSMGKATRIVYDDGEPE